MKCPSAWPRQLLLIGAIAGCSNLCKAQESLDSTHGPSPSRQGGAAREKRAVSNSEPLGDREAVKFVEPHRAGDSFMDVPGQGQHVDEQDKPEDHQDPHDQLEHEHEHDDRALRRRAEELDFILREDAASMKYWYFGWSSFFTGLTAFSVTRAVMTDEVEERTDHTIGAARAGLGLLVTVPFVPPSLKHGMPLRREASNEEAKAWVADAEERFQKAADMERRGHSWIPHVATLAVSGGAAFYLLQVEDHPKEAAITLAGGIVVGELKVWTQPKVAWRAYDAEAAARPRRGGQAPVGAAGSRWGRPVLVPSAWATREGALFGVGGIF